MIQENGRGGSQDDAFVGRAEQHVEFDAAFDDGLCVEFGQLQRGSAVVEQSGVKKIRRLPAGLGGEFAEFQYVLL